MSVGFLGGLALTGSAVVMAALAASGSSARRTTALGFAAAALLLPWLTPRPISRAVLVTFACISLLRITDLIRSRCVLPAWRRIGHVLSMVDSRLLVPGPPGVNGSALLRAVPWSLAAAGAFFLLKEAASLASGVSFWGLRWGAAAVLVYACMEASSGLVVAAYGFLGLICPVLHAAPLTSRSIQEFWGLRWNRGVSAWLRDTVFLPFARHGHAALGLWASFFVSGMLHAYMILAGLGLGAAAMVLAFFLVQGTLALLEPALGTRRWPPLAGRIWTLGALAAASPLFMEPGLRLIALAAKP